MSLQIITANNLRNGEVVYLAAGGKWTPEMKEALGVESVDALEGTLATAALAVQNHLVVDAYAIPVERMDESYAPLSMKERIRSLGPSNRTDLGKQAHA